MFEELENNRDFHTLTFEEKGKYLEDYKAKTLNPLMDRMKLNEEQRAKVTQKVDRAFGEKAYWGAWENLGRSTMDLISGVPGRFLTSAGKMLLKGHEVFGEGIEKLTGDTTYLDYVKKAESKLDDWHKYYSSFNPDAQKWNDIAVQGLVAGAGMGAAMTNFVHRGAAVSPWASQFLNSMGQGGRAAVTSTAFSSGVGDVAIEAAMTKAVRPYIELKAQEEGWSPEKKAIAETIAHFGLGFASGMTLEYKMDKIIGNPLFTDIVEKMNKEAVARIKDAQLPYGPPKPGEPTRLPHLTDTERVLEDLVNDEDAIRQIQVLFSPKGIELGDDVKTSSIKEYLEKVRETPEPKGEALVETPRVASDLRTDLRNYLESVSAERSAKALADDPETLKSLINSEEVKTILEGPSLKETSGEVPAKPEVLIKPELKATVDSKGNLLVRGNVKEALTPEAQALLNKHGLYWQPNKYFDSADKETRGVFFGKNTPEARKAVKSLLSDEGKWRFWAAQNPQSFKKLVFETKKAGESEKEVIESFFKTKISGSSLEAFQRVREDYSSFTNMQRRVNAAKTAAKREVKKAKAEAREKQNLKTRNKSEAQNQIQKNLPIEAGNEIQNFNAGVYARINKLSVYEPIRRFFKGTPSDKVKASPKVLDDYVKKLSSEKKLSVKELNAFSKLRQELVKSERKGVFEKVKMQTPESKAKPTAIQMAGQPTKLRELWNNVEDLQGEVVATQHGMSRVRPGLKVIADKEVEEKFPLAAGWIKKHGRTVRLFEGHSSINEIMKELVDAYNFHGLKKVTPEEIKQHKKVLQDFEKMLGLEHGFRKTFAERDNKLDFSVLSKSGVLTDEQAEFVTKIANQFYGVGKEGGFSFTRKPGVNTAKGARSFYDFLGGVIAVKEGKDIFHELGHWAWTDLLKGSERIEFWERMMTKYNNPEAWDYLMPTRKFALEESQDVPASITELYADLVRDYVHTYKMTDNENALVVGKLLGAAKKIYSELGKQGEIPRDLRKYIERVIQAPNPNSSTGLKINEISDLIQRSPLYQTKDEFDATIRGMLESSSHEEAVDNWLAQVIGKGESAIDAWRSTATDIEDVLQRTYADILKFHHLQVGDEQSVDRVLQELKRAFEPENEADMIEQLMRQQGVQVRNKYDPTVEDSTMPTILSEAQAKKQMAQMMAHAEESAQSGARIAYRANKQFFSDLADLWSSIKYNAKENPIEVNPQSRSDWLLLQEQLMQERLALRDVKHVEIDPSGEIKSWDVEAGSSKWFDEPEDIGGFQNPYKNWSEGEVRMFNLRLAPQVVGTMLGFEATNDGDGIPLPGMSVSLRWNPDRWMQYGAPLQMYSMFHRGIKAKAREIMFKKWDALTPQEQFAISSKWNALTKNDFVRAFRPSSGLSPELARVQRMQWKEDAKVRRKMFDLAEEIQKKFTLGEQQQIAELVTKAGDVDVSGASSRVRGAADVVNNMLEDVRTMLVDAGVPRKLLERKGNNLLPQIFESSIKAWWMQGKDIRRIRNQWEMLGAKFLAHQGRSESWRVKGPELRQVLDGSFKLKPGETIYEFVGEEGERVFKHNLQPGEEPMAMWTINEFDSQKGVAKVSAPWNKLQRELLKEQTAVVPRIAELAHQASKMIAVSKAMQEIARNPNWAFDPKNIIETLGEEAGEKAINNMFARGWVEVPETTTVGGIKRFGELAGKMVDPEAMYVLRNITADVPEHPVWRELFNKYKMGIGLWKIGKTAFNVTTHGINFLGNSCMCLMDGRNPVNVLWKGGKALLEKGSLYKQAIEEGMIDSNILRSELGLEKWMHSIEKMDNRHPTEGLFSSVGSWLGGVSRLGKKALYWPMRIYELGDQVYKMGVFAQGLEDGMSPVEAMESANRLFFDYRDVPKGIKTIRDWGVMPFVSYTYKLIPQLVRFANENPHRMIAMLGMASMANEIMMTEDYGDEWERANAFQKAMMPEWMNKRVFGVVSGQIYMGTKKNKLGHEYSEWLDYSQIMPGGMMLEEGGLFGGFPFGSNPIISIASGLYFNKDPHLGTKIAPHETEAGVVDEHSAANVKARIQYIMRTLLPNVPLYSGSYSLEKIGNALTAEGLISPDVANEMGWTGKDYYGTPMTGAEELSGWVSGVRTRKLYENQELIRKLEKNRFAIKKQQTELKKKLVDQRTTPAEQEAQIELYRRVSQEATENLRLYGNMYQAARGVRVREPKEN